MAKSRLKGLAENKLTTMVTDLETELAELKSSAPQFIDGSDVLNFMSDTGNQFDFNGLLNQDTFASTGNSRGSWEIVVEADHADAIYANAIVYMWIASTASQYHPDSGFFDLTHTGGGNKRFVQNITDLPNSSVSDTNKKTFLLTITGDIVRNVWWKVYIPALDTCSITITRLF